MTQGGNREDSWLVSGMMCSECASNIKVCDSLNDNSDYEWFCVNEECVNSIGQCTYDTEKPEWVRHRKIKGN